MLCATAPVAAQAPTSGKKQPTNPGSPTPIARFVPASAKLFVEFSRPGEADEALRQGQVGYLWSMAAGRPAHPQQPFDLRSALTQFLGPDPAIDVDELLKSELGLIAPSWSDLSSAVWYVRLPKPSPLERWFPKERRKEARRPASNSLIHMSDGMMVGVREGIIAMARRGDEPTLARETLRLMVSGVGESLQQSAVYQELASYLPAKLIAVAYWSKESVGADAAATWSSVWPPVERVVVGMSAADGRIDFAIRAALSGPQSRKTLAGHAVNRLMKLPATTLAGCATTIDFNPTAKAAAGGSSLDGWAKALSFLNGLRSADGAAVAAVPSLGPHVILAWDQDLNAAGAYPQLAILIEAKDARRLDARFEAAIESLIGHDTQDDSADDSESEPKIARGTHFGVSIAQATLYPDIEGLPLPLSKLIAELPVSWAAHGEWFIVALSREHIERILDAQFGFLPALSNVSDVQALRKRRASHTSIVLLQPDLAADVLQRWVAARLTPPPMKLDPSLFTEPSLAEAVQGRRLGIGMQVESEPGTVVVARVYPGTAAEGHLLPDDRIIGLDGRLLDLESPNADLRRRWAEPSDAHGHTFRIQREDTTIEVFLEHEAPDVGREDLVVRVLPAVRGFASALSTIRFTSVTVHPTDERHLSAVVSLRLAPSPTTASR